MIALPIDEVLPQVIAALRTRNALVLVAPPGAGKTTRVPPAIVREAGAHGAGILSREHPNLIMLQPRRVAARAAAGRIAEEQGWTLGREVGYHIRFEKRYTPATRVRILTEAILTRMLLTDPALEGIGAVILDEFHERNLHTDLTVALLREVQQTIRPDLKIVVMSATLDAEPVANFLGGSTSGGGNVPVILSEGRLFPVDISYAPPRDVPWDVHLARIAGRALEQEGDVLVFLPGLGEIERARRALQPLEGEGTLLLPLHGSLTTDEQQRALRPAAGELGAPGPRKIILATNIAETSLTIDGVRTVIDTGLVRVASFDPDRGMNRLDLERISKASATQRAGRAGRQGPGRAIRLWAEAEQKYLADFNVPEIHRVDLAETVLMTHAWGARDPREFAWFDRPNEAMLAAAEEVLTLLGALEPAGSGTEMTEIGRQMLQIPAHPRIARMLLAAVGTPLLDDALTLAAALSDDGRAGTGGPGSQGGRSGAATRSGRGDPLLLLERPPAYLSRAREQFAGIARSLSRLTRDVAPRSVTDLLLLAYPDRVARRRGQDPHAATMVGGGGVRLTPDSLTPAIASASLFLALDAHHDPRNRRAEAAVHTALPVDEAALLRLFPAAFHTETALEYDREKQKVIAFTRRYFRDLLLAEDPHGKVDPAQAGAVLAEAVAGQAEELFLRNEAAARLMARIALLRSYIPEQQWPPLDAAQLRELLTQAATNKRALAELTESPSLADAIRGALLYPLDRLLDQHAPETITVPSGSRIKLEYTIPPSPTAPPPAPILAVRLQELFGLLDTPRLANGRAPVLLHLLSPGYKPIQITTDLRSFWATAYFEVRKDLRTRYPKHKWPDDPLNAAPEAKGRRR